MDITWYDHQRAAISMAFQRPFTMLGMETGTGKTPVGLEVLERWIDKGQVPCLVVCPNTLTGNWVAEAEKWGFAYRVVRAEGTSKKRKEIIAAGPALWDVLVINYESVRLLEDELREVHFKVVLFDEIHRLKDRRAKQTQACRSISTLAQRKLGLTGTLIVHSPMDVWSEYDILDPQAPRNHPLGYGSYSNMEKTLADITPHPRLGMRARKLEFREEEVKRLGRSMARFTYEAKKDDCLDLPGQTFRKVYLDMLPEQAKIYQALKEESIAYLDGLTQKPAAKKIQDELDIEDFLASVSAAGEHDVEPDEALIGPGTGDDRRVSAKLVVTLMMRLQQVTSGFVKTDDGKEHSIGSGKIPWLEEKLPAMTWGDHKAILIARFSHDIQTLSTLCDNMKIPYVYLEGSNSKDARAIVEAFQTDTTKRVFIGNIATTSTGHTLTAADYMCFYSNSFSSGERRQVVDRIYRIGQTRKVVYFDLLHRGTVDISILSNLLEKERLSDMTVGELKRAIDGF